MMKLEVGVWWKKFDVASSPSSASTLFLLFLMVASM